MKKTLFFSLLLIIACKDQPTNSATQNKNAGNCTVTVEEIQSALIGKPLSTVANFNNCFELRDTTIDDEEEVEFKAKAYYQNGNLAFLANSADAINISRVTVETKNFSTKNGICVGDDMKKIMPFIGSEMPVLPDGYIGVLDKNNPKVMYQLNSEDYPETLEQEIGNNVKKIPATMHITAIVIDEK